MIKHSERISRPDAAHVIVYSGDAGTCRYDHLRRHVTGGQELIRHTWRGTCCLEDQANASGIVRDVGFICPLTRCRSGLTGMVATRGGYRRGRRSVLAILPIGAH